MKFVLLYFICMVGFYTYGQNEPFLGKTWQIKRIVISHTSDSLVIFHQDSIHNFYYLNNIGVTFNADKTYTGKDIYGNSQTGNWDLLPGQRLVTGHDTTYLLASSSNSMLISGLIKYRVNADSVLIGNILTEFIPVASPVCSSLQSGDWTNPTGWSCGREPTVADIVVINPNHTIIISTNSAEAQRIIYNGGTVQFTSSGAKIFIKGSD